MKQVLIDSLREHLDPIYPQLDQETRGMDLGRPVWRRRGACVFWTREALPIIKDIIMSEGLMLTKVEFNPHYREKPRASDLLPGHVYAAINDSQGKWLIDGTWQQFCESERPTDDKLLIAAPGEVSTLLENADVDERYWKIWRPDDPEQGIFRHTVQLG